MNIAIVVHSNTGHTLGVAQKIKEKLLAAGHTVNLEQVAAVNENPSAAGPVQLKTVPNISTYDRIIFGAPTQAFSLSPVMKAYLSQLPSLNGRKVGCFTTEQLPFPWMGGNNCIRQMMKICTEKGAETFSAGVVNWSSKKRESMIEDVINKAVGNIIK